MKGRTGTGGRRFGTGREAALVGRLIQRHQGSLPKATVIRMWREMLSATLRQQGPFTVAVFAPDDRSGYWDVARDHFGSFTPAVAHEKAGQGLRAVIDGQATVGVLPLPQEGDRQPSWPFLSD